jgi:hypothetical protein
VKVSTKLEPMLTGFRDASLCVSLRSCRRHPLAETRCRRCHEHSSDAPGHGTANRGLEVFPSTVQTVTEILLMSTACICVLVSLYLNRKHR